ERLDKLLERYGGRGAYGRNDQQSHAFLNSELQQLPALSVVLPPIFLFVAAFLVNMTLTRLVSLELEQIGLMKALGYGSAAVSWHYLKFVSATAIVGIVVGIAVGTWLGREVADFYGMFFSFPFLIFRIDPAVYVIAEVAALVAAAVGAARATWGVARLPPAVAMQPAAPTRYRRLLPSLRLGWMGQTTSMIARHLARWPARAG